MAYGFKSKRDAVDLKAFIGRERLNARPSGILPPENRWATQRVVRVKQTSGETCPLGGLLRIISEAEEDGEWVVTCGKPNTEFQLEYLVNLWEPLPNSTLGYASELVHADWVLRTGSSSSHRRWGAKNAEWGLTAGLPGFQAFGATSRTIDGANFIRVKQQVVPFVVGTANGAIAANSATGSVNVKQATANNTYSTGNGQTISNCYNPAFAIADGALVSVAWPQGYPLVTALTCPA